MKQIKREQTLIDYKQDARPTDRSAVGAAGRGA